MLWSPTKIGDISLLEGVQRTATSKIADLDDLNYWQRLSALGLMSLQRRRERYIILYIHKILHNKVPNDVALCFVNNPRLGIKAVIPPIPRNRAKTTLLDSSFAVRGPSLWNLLPKWLNSIESFDAFKVNLDKLLTDIPDMPPTSGYTSSNSNSLSCWI